MKRVMLTGATGFIGANLARRFVHDGHDVHLLVRPRSLLWRLEDIRTKVHFHQTDLTEQDMLVKIVRKIRPDWIFHLAAYGAYASQTDIHQMAQTNIIGVINLLEACLRTGFEAFVNTGSSSEYGYKDHAPSNTEWLEPNSHYAVTKASATLFCRYTAQSQRIAIPTLRLYSVFGPYEEPTRLLPTLIRVGLTGKWPPLVHPEIARDYVYIEDVIDAYVLAATHSHQELGAVYNIGTGIQTSLREVANEARRILSIPAEPEWGSMPNRQWDTTVWVADISKTRTQLGWQPRYTFEQGFQVMVDWFRKNTASLS